VLRTPLVSRTMHSSSLSRTFSGGKQLLATVNDGDFVGVSVDTVRGVWMQSMISACLVCISWSMPTTLSRGHHLLVTVGTGTCVCIVEKSDKRAMTAEAVGMHCHHSFPRYFESILDFTVGSGVSLL